MDLTGNTVFVPGGTSGIGLALATRLRARGNTVVIGGRRTGLLTDLAAQGFGTVRIDTTDPASITAATADVIARYPDLNVLVTMAGIMEPENWRDPRHFLDVAERTVTTNLLGPIRLIAALTTHLQTRPRATIVTVSSGLAHLPLRPTPTYNATKAAVHMLTESIRLQLADTTIEVVELVPPAVRTALMGQQDAPHAMPLDEYADETLSLLAANPTPPEILVDRVKFLRYAEAEHRYPAAVAALNDHF